MATATSVGTMAEMALIGHWHNWAQLTPWLVAHNLTAAWAASQPTNTRQLRLAQILCAVTAVMSAVGAAVHLQTNWAFEAELHPGYSPATLLFQAAQGGLPLLAPLTLALPAVLIGLATWHHPAGATDISVSSLSCLVVRS